ncbi:MAG: PIN domain-containing protein [Terriglobales bacterium]
MIAALDTNLFAYAEGLNVAARQPEAQSLLKALSSAALVPAIVYAELFRVLVGKGRRTHSEARRIVFEWQSVLPTLELQPHWLAAAIDLAGSHRLGIWDAAILDAAAGAGCDLLLSEDFQHGFRWRCVTVVNPFAHPDHPLLVRLLANV